MAIIHPTAVVEENVRLADDVVVGPYSVLGSGL
jgi:acyl-[acyl carrier protein]--UDP-N-acetylglucosamine O-acyltransferase